MLLKPIKDQIVTRVDEDQSLEHLVTEEDQLKVVYAPVGKYPVAPLADQD